MFMFKDIFKGCSAASSFVNRVAIKLHLIPNDMYEIPDYKVAPPIGGVINPEDRSKFPDPFAPEKK